MATVIDLETARERRKEEEVHPHSSGKAFCLDCLHEWAAVAPLGTLWLECPACTLVRGRFKFFHEYEAQHWTCNCGNNMFQVILAGIYCPNCGVLQQMPPEKQ
jgi:hypothetical protein